MAGQAGTLEIIAKELAAALLPLQQNLAAGQFVSLVRELGLELPGPVASFDQVAGGAANVVASVAAVPPIIAQLEAAIAADDTPGIVEAGKKLVAVIIDAVHGISALADGISAAAAGLSAADRAKVEAFAEALPGRLLDFTVVEYLRAAQPAVLRLLDVSGLVDDVLEPGDPADPLAPPWHRRELHFSRVLDLFTQPEKFLRDVFGWGDPAFDGTLLFPRVHTLLAQYDMPAVIIQPPGGTQVLEAYLLRFEADSSASPPGLTVRLRTPAITDFEQDYELAEDWSLHLAALARFDSGVELKLRPPLQASFSPPTGSAQVEVRSGLVAERADGPMVLLGETSGNGLFLQRFEVDLGVKGSWTLGSSVQVEPTVSAAIKGGQLKVDFSQGDGFIQKLASGVKLDANLDLGMHWSPSSGVTFEGSSAIEIAIPAHVSLGPIDVDTLYLMAGLAGDGSIPIELSAAISADLGPLQASVDRIGLGVKITFPSDGHGNLGPADLAFAFKPPSGVGLAIDAGVLKGGGFLYIDAERGEYAGALELVVADFLSLTGVGLITTKNPDSTPGFSLLVIITADFGAGIQLGYGFTLIGVGGLLGLNRTMNLQALMEGVRSGAIESVMFPHDVVANAPRIISDLKALFPQKEGTFLIGPMAKLGWGTPTFVSVSLGVIIEIPGNIAILGMLKVVLPDEEEALVRLQVNFAGAIEFDKERLYFFAALFDSRIVFLTIEGETGLLFAWGDGGNLVVSVGGFHPQFTPPPLPFPSPKRISVSLINTDVARVHIEGYFAVTSNTAQFGAQAELFFGLDELNVQGHLAFDALFQFSPFHFVAEISASFSVTVSGVGLFSVGLHGTLEGPSRWRVHGTASISLLFFDISVDVDVSWGDLADTLLGPIALLGLLVAELEKPESWLALLPAASGLHVSLRKLPESDVLVLHPVGALRVSQRLMPLELTLDKVGNQRPSDVNRLGLRVVSGGLAKRDDALEQFAPAQFQNMSDAEKLSRPAFAPDRGGVVLSAAGADLRSSRMVKRVVRYELIILDSNFKRFTRRFFQLTGRLFEFFLRGSSAARSPVSQAARARLQPFDDHVVVQAETYTVVFQRDNTLAAAEAAVFTSEAGARDWMQRKVVAEPRLVDALHVIPSFERAA
jgi:hypothetical protein